MKIKAGYRRISIVMALVLAVSFFGGKASAQEDTAIVEVFPIIKPWVLFKITFPTDINGDFGAVLGGNGGRYFDCFQTEPNVLICIGPFRSPDPLYLTIYDKDTGEVILQQVVRPVEGPELWTDPPSPQPPPSQDDEIIG